MPGTAVILEGIKLLCRGLVLGRWSAECRINFSRGKAVVAIFPGVTLPRPRIIGTQYLKSEDPVTLPDCYAEYWRSKLRPLWKDFKKHHIIHSAQKISSGEFRALLSEQPLSNRCT